MQATLAWLHAQRGEDAEAARVVEAALALDPSAARPRHPRRARRPRRTFQRRAGWKAACDRIRHAEHDR
jgi:hypothetical protein